MPGEPGEEEGRRPVSAPLSSLERRGGAPCDCRWKSAHAGVEAAGLTGQGWGR